MSRAGVKGNIVRRSADKKQAGETLIKSEPVEQATVTLIKHTSALRTLVVMGSFSENTKYTDITDHTHPCFRIKSRRL